MEGLYVNILCLVYVRGYSVFFLCMNIKKLCVCERLLGEYVRLLGCLRGLRICVRGFLLKLRFRVSVRVFWVCEKNVTFHNVTTIL